MLGATEVTRSMEFKFNERRNNFDIVLLYNGKTHYAGTVDLKDTPTETKTYYRALSDNVAVEASKTMTKILSLQKQLEIEHRYLAQLVNGK